MSKNLLMDMLQEDDKLGLFTSNGVDISYRTGFMLLDYPMGYYVNIFDKENNIVDRYAALGIMGGTIVSIIGRAHTGKTTLAIQLGSNIVRPFPSGSVIHFDLEGGSNKTRLSNVSKFVPSDIRDNKKYIYKNPGSTLEDMKMSIAKIYTIKKANPDLFLYQSGVKDEFGEEIIAYVPTVIIIDSVPRISMGINEGTKDGMKALEELSSQTERMRLTAAIGRFLNEIIPMCRSTNITIFLINHIKTRPGMGVPQAPELRYLKQDETLPGGKAVDYYTNVMLKIVSVGKEKYNVEEHGFDGFGATIQFVKNRTNKDGTIMPMVFNKDKGYDNLRSNVMFAKQQGLIGGNKNGLYFNSHKEKKFKFTTIHDDFKNDRDLFKIMNENLIPILEPMLSSASPIDEPIMEEEFSY